jgi:ribosomal protein S18 acetylase RimI-like enzyme
LATDVRRIRPAEWQLLRDLRLRSLNDAPEAFGQRYAEAAAQSDDEWRSNARASSAGSRRIWFIARDAESGAEIGLVQGRRRPEADCLLFSMWVAPEARRSGAGRALVDAVSDWARAWGGTRVVLWVLGTNEPALRFYERIGFRLLAEGPDAESGRAYGAFAMERPIGP